MHSRFVVAQKCLWSMMLSGLVLWPSVGIAARLTTYYRDADVDGYGNPAVHVQATAPPAGYVARSGDCNDANPFVNPAAVDVCGDAIDQNCAGGDQACAAGKGFFYFYRDADTDGYGNPAVRVSAKTGPAGYVANKLDCNDSSGISHPGATEICDGLDNDCSATTADGSGTSAPLNTLQGGVCAGSQQACTGGAWTDTYAGVGGYEAVEASCDALDNDCDAQSDEGLTTTFFRDADGDAFGNAAATANACTLPAGFVVSAGDCNDADAASHPWAAEVCGDGIDQDCNGADTACFVPPFSAAIGLAGGQGGESVQQTDDGGYILAGYSSASATYGMYAVKTDAEGQVLWSYTYGGDPGGAIRQTADGGFVLLGTKYLNATVKRQLYLVKINAAGTVQWSATYGGNTDESGNDIELGPDGGFVLFGTVKQVNNDNYRDLLLVKTNAAGTLQWSRTYGGASDESGYDLEATSDGGFALAGHSSSYSGANAYLVKTDADGIQSWYKTYGGSYSDKVCSVEQTADGGYALAGYHSYGGRMDMSLIKTDPAGNQQWVKYYNQAYTDWGYAVREIPGGGFAVFGFAMELSGADDMFLVRTDPLGNELWRKVIDHGGNETGFALELAADGGLVLLGRTDSFGAGGHDLYLVKMDTDGNFPRSYFWDADGDGYGEPGLTAYGFPPAPAGYVENSIDCNVTNSSIHPHAPEIPDDGIDQNCDTYDSHIFYRDADWDGYGNPADQTVAPFAGNGYIVDHTDCNDAQAAIHPGAVEICGDGIDQDCSGADSVCTGRFEVTFGGLGDDYGNKVERTPDGGYFVTGVSNFNGSSGDLYAVKTDANGTKLWEFRIPGAAVPPVSGRPTNDGGYLLVGTLMDPQLNAQIFLVKLREGGMVDWSMTYGGPGPEYGHDVRETNYGEILVLGDAPGSLVLVKASPTGYQGWMKSYGGYTERKGNALALTADNGCVLAGSALHPSYGSQASLLKVNSSGAVVWDQIFPTPGWSEFSSVELTVDGGQILAGTMTDYWELLFATKVTSLGSVQWSRSYQEGYGPPIGGVSARQTNDGGYVLLGTSSDGGDMNLVRIDASGYQLWNRLVGASMFVEAGSSLAVAPDGYVLLGTRYSPATRDDLLLIKTDLNGNP